MTECRYRFSSYCVLPKGHDGDHSDTPLGYEVRPIGKPEDYAEVRGMFSAAVALARCTCGSLDSVHSPTCARAASAAAAPLEPIPTDWGVGPLTHPAAVAHDPTICTGTDAVPCGCVCFDCTERGIHQAAEAADAAAEAAYQDSQNTDPQYRPSAAVARGHDIPPTAYPDDFPSVAVAPYEHPHVWEVQEVCEGCGDRRAVAPPTSSEEVGGSLDVEALAAAMKPRPVPGKPNAPWVTPNAEQVAAVYADAIRKRGGA